MRSENWQKLDEFDAIKHLGTALRVPIVFPAPATVDTAAAAGDAAGAALASGRGTTAAAAAGRAAARATAAHGSEAALAASSIRERRRRTLALEGGGEAVIDEWMLGDDKAQWQPLPEEVVSALKFAGDLLKTSFLVENPKKRIPAARV